MGVDDAEYETSDVDYDFGRQSPGQYGNCNQFIGIIYLIDILQYDYPHLK